MFKLFEFNGPDKVGGGFINGFMCGPDLKPGGGNECLDESSLLKLFIHPPLWLGSGGGTEKGGGGTVALSAGLKLLALAKGRIG